MLKIEAQAAGKDFLKVLAAVETGKSVLILKDGKPVATLSPDVPDDGDHANYAVLMHELNQ
jgi:antitoxin (DNA-binding transcriptional repressor) of toxin-antitoxin stability system